MVPVPKVLHLGELNRYRPVALTSHLMKTLERIILGHLRTLVSSTLDLLHFPYRPAVGVDDAIICLLHRALSHLESPGSNVRVMFIDFSSAFDSIQLLLLQGNMEEAGVDQHLVAWTISCQTIKRLHVRCSDLQHRSPAGDGALSVPLHPLYRGFSYNSKLCHLQKFSDDSAVVGCISAGDEQEYRGVVLEFMDWCGQNHLLLNMNKTKELVVDFC